MAKLREQFRSVASFNVRINGESKTVSRADFERESQKYIQHGYGIYFDISQKDAVKFSKAYTHKLRKQKQESAKLLKEQEETIEANQKAIENMNKTVTKVQEQLKTAKKTMDAQQAENAKAIQEREAAKAENEALKKKLEELQKQLGK